MENTFLAYLDHRYVGRSLGRNGDCGSKSEGGGEVHFAVDERFGRYHRDICIDGGFPECKVEYGQSTSERILTAGQANECTNVGLI